MTVQAHEQNTWDTLETAVTSRTSVFRYPVLSSVDENGRPQSRTVVLRAVNASARVLEFHTDVRSPKWQELANNPFATAVAYSQETQVQLRFDGLTTLYNPGSKEAAAAWAALSASSQQSYTGGPPGDDLPQSGTASNETSGGQEILGVICFRVEQLDWVRLAPENNQRALFTYDETGELKTSSWITP